VIRVNAAHWDWLVYLEMFVAGVAAGAYATATLLEFFGRGRSPVARTAHLLAFPLMVVAAVLLTLDLNRPERFWHMIVQSKTLLPMFKPWSPMSVGSWLVLLFPAFTLVSFVDALIARRSFRIGGWRYDRTLHGTPLGLIWAIVGGVLALAVAAYSGVLLSVTNFGGWSSSPVIGALYVATAAVTGVAAVLLIEALRRGDTDPGDVAGLVRTATGLVVWQLILLLIFLATLGRAGFDVFLRGGPLLAILGALLLGIVLPLVLRFARVSLRPSTTTALFAALILLGGFLLRYAVVMGPQQGRLIPGAG
jgi:formate-dependent nitrite reductase membrane component NrfD